MNKKKIMIIVSSIILVLAALFTTTYSLFYKEDVAANPSNYSTGLLQIEATSLSDTISLDSALPMTDEEGIETTPYVFSIKNTGNIDYKFDVKLLSTSSNTINSQYIKLKIDNGNPVVLSSLTNSIIKSNVVVKAKESINITLRVWLSKDTPNTEIGKTFNSQIVIDGQSIYTTSNYDAYNNNLPEAYQEVEYIGGTGTQYIKTNITCNYNDTVKMESSGNFNLGNTDAWNGVNAYLQHKFTSSTVTDGQNTALTISNDDTITASYDGNTHIETVTIESTGKSISRTWADSSYGGNVMFLNLGNGSSAYSSTGVKANLKRGKVYVDDILRMDLVPCYRKSDKVAGMYDILGNKFYTNSGTGKFTVGPDVEH
jgi:hypothetical protein